MFTKMTFLVASKTSSLFPYTTLFRSRLVRGEYGIDPEHELVRALQAAHEEVTGRALEPMGWKVVADGAVFSAAGIPTVYHRSVEHTSELQSQFHLVCRLLLENKKQVG